MSVLDTLDFAVAAEKLLVANTPTYLVKHLRTEALTNEIARQLSVEQILTELVDLLRIPVDSALVLAKIYTLVVSLSWKPVGSYEVTLQRMQAPQIEWFSRIKDIILDNNMATNWTSAYLVLPSPSVITEE